MFLKKTVGQRAAFGFGIGAAIGAGIGGGLRAAFDPTASADDVVKTAVVGGAGGAIIGLAVGSAFTPDPIGDLIDATATKAAPLLEGVAAKIPEMVSEMQDEAKAKAKARAKREAAEAEDERIDRMAQLANNEQYMAELDSLRSQRTYTGTPQQRQAVRGIQGTTLSPDK